MDDSNPLATADFETDAYWMRQALAEAVEARERGEVPVGALIVKDGLVIGRGGNDIERQQDPTAHAEMLTIRRAVATEKSRRLLDATLYVTLEPCAMCAGAVVLARIPRLVFGAFDPKSGACGSLRNVVQDGRLNHYCSVVGGMLEAECAGLLKRFFAQLRSAE
jgi:tRNA(adenine34) deaminase